MTDSGLRIAFVTATFPPYGGGAGNVALANAHAAADAGHDVHVFTATHPGERAEDTVGAVQVHRLRPLVAIGNAPFLPQLFKRLRAFDLVHLHLPFVTGSEIVWWFRVATGRPLVVTYHNDFVRSGSLRDLVYRMATLSMRLTTMRAADSILFVSEGHARSCDQRWVLQSRRDVCEIMPNSVATDLFRPSTREDREKARRRWALPGGSFLAVVISSLDAAHHYKGVDVAIDAMSALGDTTIDVVVVGGGPLRSHYERMATDLGIARRVRFLGPVDHSDMPMIYRAVDVVIMPSRAREALALVALEALASSIPVIASDSPGLRTVITEETGFLISPGNSSQLASKMRLLSTDADVRRRMGIAGRKLIEEQFSEGAMADSLQRVYATAISRRAGNGNR